MEETGASTAAGSKAGKGPRACATCARAKARCIPGPRSQEKCERCHRLRKPCSSQIPAPPRKRKGPKPTRVAELERRLEDLSARIEFVQRQGQEAPSPPESEAAGACHPPQSSEDHRPWEKQAGPCPPYVSKKPRWAPFKHLFPKESIFEASGDQQQQPVADNIDVTAAQKVLSLPQVPAASPVQAPTSTAIHSVGTIFQPPQQRAENLWPQGDEAESMLAEYKTHMGHLNPFAIVPPRMSSAQLREHRPFFWKAIMMQACLFDGARQIALGEDLLRDISETAFLRPRKSLDLLQGLQILICWYHYNLNKFQMTNLLFLARSITTSLVFPDPGVVSDKDGYTSESLEQMRAFAGTYYLITVTFTANKKPDALMNTSYLTTCCRALHSQMQYPTDELVVHLVRTAQLSQSIVQAFVRRSTSPCKSQTSKAAFIQGMRERIRTFAAGLPPQIRVNPSLVGHLQVVEIILYEHNIPELSACPLSWIYSNQHSLAPCPTTNPDPRDVELLWACVRAVLDFLDNRAAHQMGEYPRFVCMSSFDLTYVLLTMLKLVTLQFPGWDTARVKEELRFDEFMVKLERDMDYIAEKRRRKSGHISRSESSPGTQNDGQGKAALEDPFAKVGRKIRSLREQLSNFGVNSVCGPRQTAQVSDCDSMPMTIADATQDLMQDLGGGLWQDAMNSVPDWSAFLSGEPIDWTTVLLGYDMAEPGYIQ
ncbi:hypothetical protein N656DRAFT_796558 [Canariomyces notabilis]|uniref:Zn(2)-C6 fungal-type domain-containing protein n=1 Tax=Canariomyces notabilis TaxID=2074819 RepID=A0AAN6TH42_9PEZI|nr:hypothetical protein N656DRAFT_796558 [Canariomyces arenarius]